MTGNMRRNEIKRNIVAFAAVLCALLLSACVPTERTQIDQDPDFSEDTENLVKLDFVQLHNDTLDLFEDVNPYGFVRDVDVYGDNKKRTVTIDVITIDSATTEDAWWFASAMLRRINDSAAIQDAIYRMSGPDDFGGLYDYFTVRYTARQVSNEDNYLAVITVPAGEEIPFDPDIETYEEDYLRVYKAVTGETV